MSQRACGAKIQFRLYVDPDECGYDVGIHISHHITGMIPGAAITVDNNGDIARTSIEDLEEALEDLKKIRSEGNHVR